MGNRKDWLKDLTGFTAVGFALYCFVVAGLSIGGILEGIGFFEILGLIYGALYLFFGISLLLSKPGHLGNAIVIGFFFGGFMFGNSFPPILWPFVIIPLIILVLTILLILRFALGGRLFGED